MPTPILGLSVMDSKATECLVSKRVQQLSICPLVSFSVQFLGSALELFDPCFPLTVFRALTLPHHQMLFSPSLESL